MAREIEFEKRNGRIFVDGQPFDWALDDVSMDEANRHSGCELIMRAIHADIMGHFLDSLSEVLGFRPTMAQVNDALEKGFISK